MIASSSGVSFYEISAGKIRRYFSWRNFTDPWKTLEGIVQSIRILRKEKPKLLLSSGGFVSFPPTIAAWLCGVPVVVLTADYSPGLATRVSFFLCKKVLTSFRETQKILPSSVSAIHTGLPIRAGITEGKKQKGYEICGFSESSAQPPILLIMGGSLGSLEIETLVARDIGKILLGFRILFLGGVSRRGGSSGPLYAALKRLPKGLTSGRMKVFPYIKDSLPHLYAISDYAVCRGGANSLFEIAACRIPMLVIPLEKGSRGEQIQNARSFSSKSWAMVARRTELKKPNSLWEKLTELKQSAPSMRRSLDQEATPVTSGARQVMLALKEYIKR